MEEQTKTWRGFDLVTKQTAARSPRKAKDFHAWATKSESSAKRWFTTTSPLWPWAFLFVARLLFLRYLLGEHCFGLFPFYLSICLCLFVSLLQSSHYLVISMGSSSDPFLSISIHHHHLTLCAYRCVSASVQIGSPRWLETKAQHSIGWSMGIAVIFASAWTSIPSRQGMAAASRASSKRSFSSASMSAVSSSKSDFASGQAS